MCLLLGLSSRLLAGATARKRRQRMVILLVLLPFLDQCIGQELCLARAAGAKPASLAGFWRAGWASRSRRILLFNRGTVIFAMTHNHAAARGRHHAVGV